jgi:glycosidase
MWGADDPDCRKPLLWDDIKYEDERTAYDPEKSRPVDVVRPDTALRSFYKKLCRIRKENPVLVHGDLNFSIADDKKMILAYSRTNGKDDIEVIFNRSDSARVIMVPVNIDGEFKDLLSSGNISYESSDKKTEIRLAPLSGMILKKE